MHLDVLMSAIAPFETLFTQFDSAQNGVPSAAAHAELDLLAAMPASFSAPEHGVAPGAENGAVGEKKHPPQPSFLPFKPSVPATSQGNRGVESKRTRPGQNGAGKEPG